MKQEIYTVYAPDSDITFIMEDTYNSDTLVSTEVKGFYYGEPYEDATISFTGSLKANFSDEL